MDNTLKKGEGKKKMQKLLEELARNRKRPQKNIRRFCGVIHLKEDALKIQKKIRNEWD